MSKKTIVTGMILSVVASAVLVSTPVFAAGFGSHGKGGKAERPSFETLDADGDGKVSVAEMRAHRSTKFSEMDSDGDGFLSAEEMGEVAAARAAERSDAMIARMIEWEDADGDGKLSEAEMGNNNDRRMFSRLDADDDGSVSKEEYDNFKQGGRRGGRGKHRGERGQGGMERNDHSHGGGWRHKG